MFTLIVNPTSGGRKAYKTLPKVQRILDERGICYSVIETVYPPKKEQFAEVSCTKNDVVCVLGGDGTILDVMNMLPDHEMTLIYVPCGTGNDFIKCVRLPKDPIKAFLKQLDEKTRPIDYVYANDEIFMNVLGVGFDVEVLKKLDMFKVRFTGLKAYMMAVKKAVKEYRPVKCRISVDGGEYLEKDLSVLCVGNGQYFGGGMKAVPEADPHDGLLEVIEVKPVKKRMLLIMLPLFVKGLHLKYGLAKRYQCRSISIIPDSKSYEVDGEVRQAERIDASVVHGKLLFRA